MATDKELSDFLENVERRAFKQALYAVRKDESALDIVQDAMIKLAEKYGDKPPAELAMMFQGIVQNTVRDYFRREKVRSSWISRLAGFGNRQDEQDGFDAMDMVEAETGSYGAESGLQKRERQQMLDL